MPLITCPECHKEYSDQLKSCIHCGHKVKSKKNLKNFLWIIPTLLIFGYLLGREDNSPQGLRDSAYFHCKQKIKIMLNDPPNLVIQRSNFVSEEIIYKKFTIEFDVIASNETNIPIPFHFQCNASKESGSWFAIALPVKS